MSSPLEQFLSSYDPAVRALALAARKRVLGIAPDAQEKVLRPWKTIAYGRSRKFCAISPHKAWVNLQFHDGASLDDPSRLLEGTGKSMRHVKLSSARDLQRRALSALIRSAAERAR
ncbi:MAG: DUF1801 domain-containing protein [Myxococcales bacterium]|nr:MAG: DUF1801 domain-containing protein [Myxococcales bacterium]